MGKSMQLLTNGSQFDYDDCGDYTHFSRQPALVISDTASDVCSGLEAARRPILKFEDKPLGGIAVAVALCVPIWALLLGVSWLL